VYGIGRQPGSAFKPFVYATAFEKGHSDKEVVIDEETNFGIYNGKPYIPQNFDGRFRGPVTLREALAQSLNIPSIKVLLYFAGIEDSIKTAKRMGITTLKDASFYGPSLVLGGGEVRLLELVSAYGCFATGGLKTKTTGILRIETLDGQILEDNSSKVPKRVLSSRTAYLISDILSDNEARAPMFGYHSLLYFPDFQVAVKTGTTNDSRDGWVVGYTPNLVVGVWSGNNNNEPMTKTTGYSVSGPIWHSFMKEVLPLRPKEDFPSFKNK